MQRCTELNVTNRSRAYPGRHRKEIQKDEDSFQYSVLGNKNIYKKVERGLRHRPFTAVTRVRFPSESLVGS